MFETFRFRHFFGIFGSLIFAGLLGLFPWLFLPFPDVGTASASTVTIFFVFILAFLMNNAIRKNYELRHEMNIELSRLRRVHHLAEKIGNTENAKQLRQELEKTIEAYLQYLHKHSLAKYKDARGAFRGITYAIYEFEPSNKREQAFLKELFSTTRELALTRQNISSLLDRRISAYGWIVLLVIETLVITATLLTQGITAVGYMISVATMATIFIITLMIREIDDNSLIELQEFGELYGQNKTGLNEE